jgi:hypothetical protein
MINKEQRVYLMADLWPNACKQQGWDRNDNARRYALFAELLGHWPDHKRTLDGGGHISCNDFVKTRDRDDFGTVKARLLLLAAADLLEDDPVKRTRLWIVNYRLIPCYRLYRPGTALTTIMKERFKRVPGMKVLEDLTSEELEHLIFTLEARVNTLRNVAGHTKHEMCQAANVDCWNPGPDNCPKCNRETRDDKEIEKAMEIDEDMAAGPVLPGGSENEPF